MRKFNTVFKEKQNESVKNHEDKILNEFKSVYTKLLENYNITNLNDLDESNKTAFTKQLNEMWDDTQGISEKGVRFLNDNCLFLTESSTPSQKKNYLKQKSSVMLKESFRQYDLKYEQVKGENLTDVLTPNAIVNILSETFVETTTEFLKNIQKELKESVKK